jgi:hypothetical protein
VRGQKPVFAIANTFAPRPPTTSPRRPTSSASPSAELGSIGVYAAHQDRSAMQEKLGVKTTLISAGKYKVEGNPFEPLSEEARQALQAEVDGFYEMFVADVATRPQRRRQHRPQRLRRGPRAQRAGRRRAGMADASSRSTRRSRG